MKFFSEVILLVDLFYEMSCLFRRLRSEDRNHVSIELADGLPAGQNRSLSTEYLVKNVW